MAWKKLGKHAQWIKPTTYKEVSVTSLWFNPNLDNRLQASFSRERTGELHKFGLKRIQDTWNPAQIRCHTGPEARARFPQLRNEEEASWEAIVRTVSLAYGAILTRGPLSPMPSDWLGFYASDEDNLPFLITESPGACNITCELRSSISILGLPNPIYYVNPTSKILSRILDINLWIQANRQVREALELDIDYEERLFCIAKNVRVVEILRGPHKLPTQFFYGPILRLNFDPLRYGWPGGTPLL